VDNFVEKGAAAGPEAVGHTAHTEFLIGIATKFSFKISSLKKQLKPK
jgi:hypothetical protein